MELAAVKNQALPFERPASRRHRHAISIPPTHAEKAVASTGWERRGLLGRLVRLDGSRDS
jgi:hypothetical protein